MKRLYISIWCGIAIPFGYALLLVALDSMFGGRIASASGWMVFPLSWSGTAFSSLYHPTIRGAGDVFGAATNVIVVTIVSDVIFYSALTYIVLSLRGGIERRRTAQQLVGFERR